MIIFNENLNNKNIMDYKEYTSYASYALVRYKNYEWTVYLDVIKDEEEKLSLDVEILRKNPDNTYDLYATVEDYEPLDPKVAVKYINKMNLFNIIRH